MICLFQFAFATHAGETYYGKNDVGMAVFLAKPVGEADIPLVDGVQRLQPSAWQFAGSLLLGVCALLGVIGVLAGLSWLLGDGFLTKIIIVILWFLPFARSATGSLNRRLHPPQTPYVHISGAASDAGGLYGDLRTRIMNDPSRPRLVSETRNQRLVQRHRELDANQYDKSEQQLWGQHLLSVKRR